MKNKIITEGDHIGSLSNEELAEFLYINCAMHPCPLCNNNEPELCPNVLESPNDPAKNCTNGILLKLNNQYIKDV